MRQGLLLVLLVAIVLADAAQPLLLPWEPRLLAAVAGACIYSACAVGAWRGWRPALAVVAAMPLVPAAAFALYAVGAPVPMPTWPMLSIAVLQVAAALLAIARLRSARADQAQA